MSSHVTCLLSAVMQMLLSETVTVVIDRTLQLNTVACHTAHQSCFMLTAVAALMNELTYGSVLHFVLIVYLFYVKKTVYC